MRSFAVVLVVAAIAIAGLGLAWGSSLAYSIGVRPAIIAATLKPGDRACQAPIRPPSATTFDRVGVVLVTFEQPGPELAVDVLDDETGRRLGSGRLPAGYADLDPADIHEQVAQVGRIDSEAPLRVCVANRGARRVAVVGQAGIASPITEARLNGQVLDTDLTVNLRSDRRSFFALLPDIAERAARFRAGWVTPPVYLGLAVLLVVGAPLVLARSLGRLSED
jgi:hypothetical protein